jgi:RecA/RadA recombinase
VLEISGPPGGGKSAVALGLALSARQSRSEGGKESEKSSVEVLIVGEL